MSFNIGSGGGSSRVNTSQDVAVNNIQTGDGLFFSADIDKYTNAAVRIVVAKNADNTWPARPTNARYVEWVGPGSPEPPVNVSFDIWLDTSA